MPASSWQYADWNSALCDHYFPTEAAGLPVIFLVDDDHLAAIHPSGDAAAAVDSLMEVVWPRLTPGHGNGTFSRFEDEARSWKLGDSSDQPPPFLCLLAVCVLAASRMGAGAVHASNYREPFGELLGLPTDRIPDGYGDTMPILWRYLHWWLEERLGGARGRSTIVEDNRLANIGFAISQTLFRASDHARLAEFFRWIDLEPGEEISGPELIAYFRVWAPPRGLSAGAQHMLTSPDYAEALERILAAHASRWDGTRIPGTAERQARVLVVVRAFPGLTLELVAPQPSGFPSVLEVRGSTGSVSMRAAVEGWYDSVPLELDDDLLLQGAVLEAGRFSFRIPGAAVQVLRLDERAGGWATVEHLRPGQRHWVLAHEEIWDDVLNMLAEEPGESREDERIREVLPRWRLLRDVTLDSPPAGSVPDALRCLVPTVRNRLSLEGGLRLPRGTDVYLLGGEPNLWLPGSEGAPSLRATIDGRPVSADGLLVPLSALEPPLDVGEHVIEVPGALRRRFRTTASALTLPPARAAVRHVLRLSESGRVVSHVAARRADESDAEAAASIFGALVEGRGAPDPGARPVLLRRAAQRTIVLGARPDQREVIAAPPEAPAWMGRWGLSERLFEHKPSFDPVWVIQEWQAAPTRRGRAVSRVDPLVHPPVPESGAAWAREFLADAEVTPGDADLWNRYREIAAALVA
jgi:hypothetical protein